MRSSNTRSFNNRSHDDLASTYSGFSTHLSSNSASSKKNNFHINKLNTKISTFQKNLEHQLIEHHAEAVASRENLNRAQRLTDRIEIISQKLQNCFNNNDSIGKIRPGATISPTSIRRQILNNRNRIFLNGNSNDAWEDYDPAAFLFAEAQFGDTYNNDNETFPQIILDQIAIFDSEDAPNEFICPITKCVMIDPVSTSDGHVYDRAAITEWLLSFQSRNKTPTSPLTNLVLKDLTLTPNSDLNARIREYISKNLKAKNNKENADKFEETTSKMSKVKLFDDLTFSRIESPNTVNSTCINTFSASEESQKDNMSVLTQCKEPPYHLSLKSSVVSQKLPTQNFGLDKDENAINNLISTIPPFSTGNENKYSNISPIWSSSVVPVREPDSYVLNMIRTNDSVVIPNNHDNYDNVLQSRLNNAIQISKKQMKPKSRLSPIAQSANRVGIVPRRRVHSQVSTIASRNRTYSHGNRRQEIFNDNLTASVNSSTVRLSLIFSPLSISSIHLFPINPHSQKFR